MPALQLNWLIDFDHALFAKINLEWTNSLFDWFFPFITDWHKDPRSLIVVLPLLLFWIYKQRLRAARWILVTIISVSISDAVAYRLVKANALRDRPQFTGIPLELRTHEHTGTSFPSNHASNVFAAATSLSGGLPALSPVFFLIAFLVAYSRVYVGVHFPLDVFSGALLGILIAALVRLSLRRWIREPQSKQDHFDPLADSILKSESRPR